MIFNFRQLHRALTPVLQALLLILTISFVYHVTVHYTFGYPLLIEGILQIVCSEVNYYKQERRYQRVQNQEDLGEKGIARTECVATVIGYREDPCLFRKCLESYRNDSIRTIRALVIGIDGNGPEDQQMVEVAKSVYGAANLTLIKLDEPFGALATQMIDAWKTQRSSGDKTHHLDRDEFLEQVFHVLVRRAATILQDLKLLDSLVAGGVPRAICITQPHVCKKDIMFSAFLFALALARAHSIPFVWSSDSDSYYPHTTTTSTSTSPSASPVHRVLATMSGDPLIAGSCGALRIHNATRSLTTRLGASAYATDLALTSAQNSAFDTTDCQPGPCAAFAAAALSSVLVPWYSQTFLGTRPRVNEDRHLTSLLLARGERWKTTFHPRAEVLTAAPETPAAWVTQQVRWGRAIALETAAQPGVLLRRTPALAVHALRRVVGPHLHTWVVARYLACGTGVRVTGLRDVAARVAVCAVYTAVKGGGGWRTAAWACASQVFSMFPQPPVVFWASATVLDGRWGNEKGPEGGSRVGKVLRKWRTWAPFVCVALWAGMVAAALCKLAASVALVDWEGVCAAAGGVVAGVGTLYVIMKE